jgi:glycerol-3-phosphate acyltransferase PlsX
LIAVDLLGGDDAPAVVVGGVLRAMRVDPGLRLMLVGPPEVASLVLRELGPADRERVAVRAAHRVVGMGDSPMRATRADTTIRAAAAALASGEADALVSAGSSGATVTAAVLELGRIEGVRQPALAAWIPAVHDQVLLLDVGASVETHLSTLRSHALLGNAHAVGLGMSKPRIGLLSVGREPGKGDRARRAAEAALAELPIEFAGLVEGFDVCIGERADVIVTDGFTGNVLLKGIEGAYALAAYNGALESRVDVPRGAPRAAVLLGVPGIVVVCHGAADDDDLAAAIALAASSVRARQ